MIRDIWHDASRHNGHTNVARLKERGAVGIYSRCTIGIAPVDPRYFETKEQCEGEGVLSAAYGVLWPSNRNPEREAQHCAENLVSGSSPKMPVVVVGDFELGHREHPAGHHLLSGKELIEHAVRWLREMERLVSIPVLVYTAKWYWNCKKLLPYIGQGEQEFPGIFANYPYDPRQIKYLPPRYVKGYDPYALGDYGPLIPKPWIGVVGWQWTSKLPGKAGNNCESTFLDGNIMFKRFVESPVSPPISNKELIKKEVALLQSSAARLNTIADNLE